MDEYLRKKYVPMTESTYYTLLAVTSPRHGYAIMQYVAELTKGRFTLGTGTLYTMVGRLVSDGVIEAFPRDGKKTYRITDVGMSLLREETMRLGNQMMDGLGVLGGGTNRCGRGICARGASVGESGITAVYVYAAEAAHGPRGE